MEVHVDVRSVFVVDETLVLAVARLLPQLSSSARLDRDLLARIVSSESSTLYVARLDDDAIVGMLTLVMYPIPTGLRAHIDDVVVDVAARGRKVGETLVNTALAAAAAAGVRSVDLTSRPDRTAATRLYTRLGFSRRDTDIYRLTSERQRTGLTS